MINRVDVHNGLNTIPTETKDRELDKAASEFESVFIYYMLKTMRESVMKADLFGDNKAEEMYRGMLDEEISKVIAKAGGIGLKDTIIKGMNMGTDLKSIPTIQNNVELQKKDGVGDKTDSEKVLHTNNASMYQKMDDKVFNMPLKGEISSIYGIRKDPFVGEERFHRGIDIAAQEGTSVHPAMDGVVIFSGEKEGYGNIVEIRHDNGYLTRYAHNQKNMVKEGDRVTTSDIIAAVGKTGRATGPHLHFEVRIEGFAVNPINMINFG
ncbi:MAG: peptidoglycan DD-metalloendopeptidase family protein [Deltaproteobacteria bacterium]|nr:peptidoglycan DD-metalloendopeptidase family protein [Deltaproteobacteria bacterium]